MRILLNFLNIGNSTDIGVSQKSLFLIIFCHFYTQKYPKNYDLLPNYFLGH